MAKSRRTWIISGAAILSMVVIGVAVLWHFYGNDPPAPIFWAVMEDDAEMIKSEIRESPDCVNLRWRWLQNATPLLYVRSATAGRLLVDAGADVNAADDNGYTPLHHAVRICSTDLVSVLLVHGADANARETYRVAEKGIPPQCATPLDRNLIELQQATLDISQFPPGPLPEAYVDKEREAACDEIRKMLLQHGARSAFDLAPERTTE